MNLVAKEYVACQIGPTPGVLILSPFAGAGGTMAEALLVNPYEVDLVAETIHKALSMKPEVVFQDFMAYSRRFASHRSVLFRNGVGGWINYGSGNRPVTLITGWQVSYVR